MEPSFERDFLLCYHTVSSMLPSMIHVFLMHVMAKLALLLLSGVVLFSSSERPPTHLRIWASVCLLHEFLDCLLNRYTRVRIYDHPSDAAAADGNDRRMRSQRIMKRLEVMSEIMTSVLWSIAFYWSASGGLSFLDDSPSLRWLKVVFISFEGSSMLLRISAAFVTFLIVFGCLPNPAIAVTKGDCQDSSSTTLASDLKQGGHFTSEPEDSSQVISDEETGERSDVAQKVKKMTVGGEEE